MKEANFTSSILKLLCCGLLLITVACSEDSMPGTGTTEPDVVPTDPVDPTDPTTDPADPNTDPSKPNILFIIADDMGRDASPGYNEGVMEPSTPNLDNLISSGLVFNNFWSAPTCSPTRAQLLTGKYGRQTGVLEVGDHLSSNELALQKHIENELAGAYDQGVVGKWHLSNSDSHPNDIGIDYFAGISGGGVSSYYNWDLNVNGVTSTSTEYTTTKLTDLAIDWIDGTDKPWFLWLAYNAPHTPFHLPPSDLHNQGGLVDDQQTIDDNPLPYYLAAIEAMDTEIGRLLSSLEAAERDNTIIIFIGDNGTPNQVHQDPYPNMRVKGSLYQGGVNVPLIVSGKDVTRIGQTEDALINATDIFATISSIAGINSSPESSSTSFETFFANSSATQEFTYQESTGNSRAGYTIRNQSYKLFIQDNGDESFYNLIADPYEAINLFDGTLTESEMSELSKLEAAAATIRM